MVNQKEFVLDPGNATPGSNVTVQQKKVWILLLLLLYFLFKILKKYILFLYILQYLNIDVEV